MLHSGLFKLLRCRSSKNCIIVCYHRIKDVDKSNTAFDDSVFGPNQDEFARQVKWLKSNNDILSESELLSVVRGEYTPPRRSVVLTFDDGYIDNYTLAYPVLRSFNVPAIFFIPSKAIEERSLGWWDQISFLVKTSKKPFISLWGENFSLKQSRDQVIRFALSLIYQNTLTVEQILKELITACEVDLPPVELQGKELMTWEQLREVSQNNIAIGSHTHSHLILSNLDDVVQKFEISFSKQHIEKNIGMKVCSMSYPCGNYNNFSISSKKMVAEAGYDLAFSFLTGVNSYGVIDPMDVRRIAASNYFARFVASFELPEIFCDNHDSIVDSSGFYS